MQPWEINRYLILSSRLPHNGWAAFGPYEDLKAKWADRIIIVLTIVFSVLFAIGVL